MVELKDFLLKACQEENMRDKLRSLVGKQASKVGLLVSQRMVNLPPQLLPPLYDALFDEVSWATEDEVSSKYFMIFLYFSFFFICMNLGACLMRMFLCSSVIINYSSIDKNNSILWNFLHGRMF